MKCDRVRDLASEALDGALAPNESEFYFEHLRSCPPCLAFQEDLRHSLALLGEIPAVDASEGFEDRVLRRLAEERFVDSPRESGSFLPQGWREALVRAFAGPLVSRWTFAGVAAAIAVLALVSSDPAPHSAILATRDSVPESAPLASADPAQTESPATSSPTASSPQFSGVEDENVAQMPAAVEEYLRNAADLRLSGGEDRYRRSNYSYPVRRVADPSPFQLTGESLSPLVPSSRAGVGEDATVISF